MNKSELVRAVAERESASVSDVNRILTTFLDIVSLALACGEDVNLRNFGKLETMDRKAFKRKHPGTGEMIVVPERRSVAFRPGTSLMHRVNGST